MALLAALSTIFLAVAVLIAVSAIAQCYASSRIYASTQASHNNGTVTLPSTDQWSTGGGLLNSTLLRNIGNDGVRWVHKSQVEVRWWAIALLIAALVLWVYTHFFVTSYRA